jgi:hypothetical protein
VFQVSLFCQEAWLKSKKKKKQDMVHLLRCLHRGSGGSRGQMIEVSTNIKLTSQHKINKDREELNSFTPLIWLAARGNRF